MAPRFNAKQDILLWHESRQLGVVGGEGETRVGLGLEVIGYD